MDLVVKATKGRVPARARHVVERKAARLSRHDPRVQRLEVHLIVEPSPRVDGGNRVEASCWTDRRSFHARAAGASLDGAIERVIARLDRQLDGHEGKRRRKLIEGANRVKSAPVAADIESDRDPGE